MSVPHFIGGRIYLNYFPFLIFSKLGKFPLPPFLRNLDTFGVTNVEESVKVLGSKLDDFVGEGESVKVLG